MSLATLAALGPVPVGAHTVARTTPETLWPSWSFDPILTMGMLFSTWAYIRGLLAHRRKAGEGSALHQGHALAWSAAMVTLALALFSPLDALGGSLFSAHMVQHVLLFLVAPMLLAAARPLVALPWALPAGIRK